MINKELSDMIKDIALKKDPFVLSVFVYQKMKDAYFIF